MKRHLVVVFPRLCDVVVGVQNEPEFGRSKRCGQTHGKGRGRAFSAWINRFKIVQSVAGNDDVVFEQDGIHVVQGRFGSDVFESGRHGVGFPRIGICRGEEQRASIGKDLQVGLALRDQHVPNQDVEVTVAVHVGSRGRSPCAVWEGDRVLPRRRDVRWCSCLSVEAMQFAPKRNKQLRGSIGIHVDPKRWCNGNLVVVVSAAPLHGAAPFFDRRVRRDVVATGHALSVETRRRGRIPRHPAQPIVHTVVIGVDRKRGCIRVTVWCTEGENFRR